MIEQLLAEARQTVPEIDAARLRASEAPPLILDVREDDEWAQGHLPGALHLSRGLLELKIDRVAPDKDADILLYCGSGVRSLLAGKTLLEMGYARVSSLAGGFAAWQGAGHPVERERALTPDQLERYSRHILLPQVGKSGQARLLDSRVLLVGAGGLGSPAGLYLAAAGVGTLGIIDSDRVDATNLQRQVLHATARIGEPKTESAAVSIRALNPDVALELHSERLTAANAMDLLARYDVIVDGADNFPTRYLLNDACFWLKKPIAHGSVYQFDGQAMVLDTAAGGPCYRCLFPEPPPPGAAPNCQEAGVLGVLPGLIGLIQATESLKLLLGIGSTLRGRLLLYDALNLRFREITMARDPQCALCGDRPRITELVEYGAACSSAIRDS